MIPEITIKISFGKEAAEIPISVRGTSSPDAVIAPPEIPGEAAATYIPPPPDPEDGGCCGSSGDYPPPPAPVDEDEPAIPAPPTGKARTGKAKPA
ncbi:MAG: hypothetical protein F9K32_18860 [Desulfobulbaceae bacterium]|nr:MAG: hypothetical protein F9K32_18860 [Desulfobulbaceae bacterium]